ncbi:MULTISPECIES: amino acid ABC transporter permease [Sodalis]|jgi:polar amino acid transport system permease protein|uniref:Polar amino acid transport system permease protein n=1 Tax=Sodalis ligni TaxID=2697027 RepID=A0A4R1N6W4_9GAMM|nr:amino acid ABC transporter permease [Sodalis ligni]TCL03004.1 polar amino acid transport system permease protein [Sodalis ligni]
MNELLITSAPLLLKGLGVTLLLSAASIIGGTLLGLLAAVLRSSRNTPAIVVARLYTELFRGSPVLITLMFIYFGVAYFGYDINIFAAGVIGLSVYQGAYIGEVFRAGIEAVPKGQWEVAQILGMNKRHTFLSVILPQTRRIVLPPLIGQYLSLIKDTSIISMIGMSELLRQGQSIVDRVGQPVAVYGLVAALYFIICFPISRWVQHQESNRSLLS